MTGDRWMVEFDGEIDEEGRISVPEQIRRVLPARFGALHVRLAGVNPMQDLVARGVTDEEVNAIASLQSTPQEHVFRALAAEGRLAKKPLNSRWSAEQESEP